MTAVNTRITGAAFVTVQAAPAVTLQIRVPSSVTSDVPFSVTVVAVDPYGNIDTNHQGSVALTSSDTVPAVVLPGVYTFTTGDGGDNGVHDFLAGVTLITPGNQTITATDTASGITGTATVTVSPPPALPPGGGAREPRSPITNGVGQTAQQAVLLDQIFSSLRVKNSPLVSIRPEHKGRADHPPSDGEWLVMK